MTDPKNISFEEALELVSDVARNGQGTAQLRALQLVLNRESGAATIPEPLGDEEKLELMSMMMASLGQIGTQFAYRRAFPHSRRPVNHAAPKLELTDLNMDESVLPETLKQFYRMFPEVKRGGYPPGFPVGKGIAVKKAWCQKQARKILLDRKQHELDSAALTDKTDDEADNAPQA
jgi:hypothetical protein